MKVKKGWGYEDILISTPDYCLKKLVFTEQGNYFSMHFHKDKIESWYVESGSFELEFLDLQTATVTMQSLKQGDTITIDRMRPHRLRASQDLSIVLEVSTEDTIQDNYRVLPGMSQEAPN